MLTLEDCGHTLVAVLQAVDAAPPGFRLRNVRFWEQAGLMQWSGHFEKKEGNPRPQDQPDPMIRSGNRYLAIETYTRYLTGEPGAVGGPPEPVRTGTQPQHEIAVPGC